MSDIAFLMTKRSIFDLSRVILITVNKALNLMQKEWFTFHKTERRKLKSSHNK